MESKYKKLLGIGLVAITFTAVTVVIFQLLYTAAVVRNAPMSAWSDPKTELVEPVENRPAELLVVEESTEKWKVCRSEKVGYEVKYPGNWNIYHLGPWGYIPDSCEATTMPGLVASPEDQHHAGNIGKARFVWSYTDTSPGLGYTYSGSQSLEEYLQKSPGYLAESYKETLIQGKRAVWRKQAAKTGDITTVLIYNHNTVFEIQSINVSAESFDLFLSTFKFLK